MNPSRLERALNRTVSADEVHAALHREIPASEREDVKDLIRWFTTRYPTAEERLAYVRQAYARWRASTVSARAPLDGAPLKGRPT